VPCDATDKSALQRMVARAAFGRIDILINAGA
jgi:NAD(P)-dependent dehydrogenase (short-subunit alcohol dehydrogenase family)